MKKESLSSICILSVSKVLDRCQKLIRNLFLKDEAFLRTDRVASLALDASFERVLNMLKSRVAIIVALKCSGDLLTSDSEHSI
jgi:hypothetical protein